MYWIIHSRLYAVDRQYEILKCINRIFENQRVSNAQQAQQQQWQNINNAALIAASLLAAPATGGTSLLGLTGLQGGGSGAGSNAFNGIYNQMSSNPYDSSLGLQGLSSLSGWGGF